MSTSNKDDNVEKIATDVINVVEDVLKVDKNSASLEATLAEDLGADSLDVVELVMALESKFDIEIPDEDAGKISTIRDIVEYVKSKVSSAVVS